MRAQFLAFTFLATAVASSALAQQAAPPARTFMDNKEIMGLVDKAKADRKGDAPLVAEPILSLAPYRAQLEYRPGISPAAVHEKDAELMVVLDGTGNIVTKRFVVSVAELFAAIVCTTVVEKLLESVTFSGVSDAATVTEIGDEFVVKVK